MDCVHRIIEYRNFFCHLEEIPILFSSLPQFIISYKVQTTQEFMYMYSKNFPGSQFTNTRNDLL